MGYYSNTIYPWLLDHTEPIEMPRLRRMNLKDVKGKVLEIGIGTGANLLYFPKSIKDITAIDPIPAMRQRAENKAINNQINVDWYNGKGENLPFAENSFNSVVSTGLLCSVEDVNRVLNEIFRVLKPTGKYFFLEHGLSKDDSIRRYQRIFNGVNKIVACGCNLTRDIKNLVEISNFENSEFYEVKPLKGIAKLYEPILGVAKK